MSFFKIGKNKKKNSKSDVIILGGDGAGKSTLLQLLQKNLSMKDKGKQNLIGMSFHTLRSESGTEEIYSYSGNYDESMISNVIKKPSTKCVIFVIDSRKQYVNTMRYMISSIATILQPQCHLLFLCNKQDLINDDILSPDEIRKVLNIDDKHSVIGCSFTNNTNTQSIISYLYENHIIPEQEEELKQDDNDKKGRLSDHKKGSSFLNPFKKKGNKKSQHEVVMIFGLDKVGKSKLLDSFGFGKKSKTSIAIFEAETLKANNTEFHVWNYEQRSWPMAKSFFVNCSLVIFVIDGTKFDSLKSEKQNTWTVDAYLQKLLANNQDINGNKNKKRKNSNNKHQNDDGTLKCPFLFYINKNDLEDAVITAQDLEKELHLSRVMKSKGIKHYVQQCSVKSKKGIYDGLIWCFMNGILTQIPQIKQYADDNDIKLPSISSVSLPQKLKEAQTV